MTSWELAARSINSGISIRHIQWPPEKYIYYCTARKKWLDQRSDIFDPSFVDIDGWQEYIEPKKEPEYLYEFIYQEQSNGWFYISNNLRSLNIIEEANYLKFKLLRKFDPDTLEEIIEDQNAKD